MAAKQEARILIVADALVKALSAISHKADSNAWFTSPARVELGKRMGSLAQPGYALFVEATYWSDEPLLSSPPNKHEATVDFTITAVVNKSKNPHRETHRLAADVLRAIALKETDRLDGLVTEIDVLRYSVVTEFVERAGRGEAEIVVRAKYRWTHDSP